jgi:hypothetical protein
MHHYNDVYKLLHKIRGQVPSLLTYGNIHTVGGIGVPIFFVISGFVMGLLTIQKPDTTPSMSGQPHRAHRTALLDRNLCRHCARRARHKFRLVV